MKHDLAVVTASSCLLRREPGQSPEENRSSVEDEIFSGWAVCIHRDVPECTEGCGWVKVTTHYGYNGYVRERELRRISPKELKGRQDKGVFMHMLAPCTDVLDQPKVQGAPLEQLIRCAIVEVLQRDAVEGWSLIRTAAGTEGYIHTVFLAERKEDDEYLLLHGEAIAQDHQLRREYFAQRGREQLASLDEEAFREGVVRAARKYLDTQYRWGGKSSQGIDCSGLAFMSYYQQGMLIYRDAAVMEEYPLHPIDRKDLKKGDLIMFPGHVAIYLGEERYIHSTGYNLTPCVTINSLDPADPLYREDLAGQITECAGLF